MMCYKDRKFCSAQCKNDKCDRQFTDEIHEAARKWWGGDDAPIAFMDFSTTCQEYQKP